MRKDIEFKAEDGTILRGWHYVPDAGKGPFATVVMAHGFTGVKEIYLDKYAEAFENAGMAAIVFDHRNFGASDGEPRLDVDPWQQVNDYRDAITWAETLPQTDAARIGVWGSSYAGGHVIVVGARDKRVKAVVAQVPLVSGRENERRLIRADNIPGFHAACDEDRRRRYRGEAPGLIPVVAQHEGEPCALPTPDSWEFMMATKKNRAPSWENMVTLRSVEMFTEYEPGAYINYVSPTPLMIIVALQDRLTVADITLSAYERALHPKKLVTLPGGHFDAYVQDFAISSGAATAWFRQHLLEDGGNSIRERTAGAAE